MKALLAGAVLAASAGLYAVAQPSPNAFMYWNLIPEGDGASLVSDRDYHRPEGLRVSFSCRAGVRKVTVREYLNSAERAQPSLPLSRRDGRLRIHEGCDAVCERHSDTALRNYVKPADLTALRPTRYGEAALTWNSSTKTLIDRYVLDPTQFGDAAPSAVQAGLAKQRSLLAQFKATCNLK